MSFVVAYKYVLAACEKKYGVGYYGNNSIASLGDGCAIV